jgi:hypothetical protein
LAMNSAHRDQCYMLAAGREYAKSRAAGPV